MKYNLSLINALRFFVIICLLFSAAALPANSPKIVQAQPLLSEETFTVIPEVTEEVTPTPEVTEEVIETPTLEVTEEVTETPTPEVTEEVTETPTPEVTEEVTETPELTEEVIETPELTEEPVQEDLESQATAICASAAFPIECEALVALYQSTNGTNWKNRTGWLISETHCDWHGVDCESGRVTEIILASNNLTGTLPIQIGNFPSLKVLNVQTNAIGGVIPNEIGNLKSLITLLISFNSFEGSIPTTIGQLKNLYRVELSRNKLTGAIPSEIGEMTGLVHIWGYDNQLTGPIPSTLNNLTKLTEFHFSGNQLSGAIPDLSAVSNLTRFYLANNKLTGSIPSSISKKGSLVILNLSNNRLEGNLSNFADLTNLEALNLSGNLLTGPIPASFGGFTKLKYLNLGGNPLGGTIPSQLGNLTNLEELYLNNNGLSGAWPGWLNTLTKLERLNLSNNFELGGLIPPEIGNLVNLRLLDISHNHFWGEIPLAITNLTKLNIKVESIDARAYTDIGHNHLTSKITKVRDFLSKKDPDWSKTQTPANPIPLIQSLNPPRVKAGSDEILLEVRGKSMMDGAVVFVDGLEYPTTFINNWTLEIVIPASELTTEKAIEITVKNPWPTVQPSAVYQFYVSNLEPAVGSTVLSRRPNFWWESVPGADLYQFQISTYKSFGSSVTKLTSPTNELTLIKDLPINKMMYWRVRARVGGVYGDWSPTYSFRSAKPPSNPVLSSPANNSLTTNYTPKLSWRIVSLPSGTVFEKYQVQVASDLTFDTIVLNEIITNRSKPTYTLLAGVLNPNWKYYWRVRAFNTLAQESNWSTPRAIRSAMLPPVLSIPTPGETAKSTRPLVTWEPVDGASSYLVQFSTYSNFSSLLHSGKPVGTEYTPTRNMPQNRTIYWRVRAIGPNGPSVWAKSSFRSANPPATPLLSAPSNKALLTSYTPTLKWRISSLPRGTVFKHYRLQIALDNQFSEPLVYEEYIPSRSTNFYTIPAELASNTRYYWRVQAWNMDDHYSTWSAVRYFRAAMLPVDTLFTPAEKTLRPVFNWSAVDPGSGPLPTSYTIQFSLNSSFGTLINNSKVLTTTYTPTRDLPKNRTIHWRVRANGDNGPSLWTPSFFTSVNPPSTPSLMSPANNTLFTDYQPILKWSVSSLPSGTVFKQYTLEISESKAFNDVIETYTILDRSQVTQQVGPLNPNTRYYWRVRSENQDDQYSTWSAVRYFRTALTEPQGLAIQPGTEKTRRPIFTWAAVPGAASYTIQLSLYANFRSMLTSGKSTGMTYTPSISLPQNKTIYWRVRANGDNGPSLWSTTLSFTSANPPSTPSLVSPANGAVLKTLPKLDWSNSSIPTGTTFSHYVVVVASDSGFISPVFTENTNISEWNDWGSIAPLSAKTRYYWRVSAFNEAGEQSNWSSRRYFTSP